MGCHRHSVLYHTTGELEFSHVPEIYPACVHNNIITCALTEIPQNYKRSHAVILIRYLKLVKSFDIIREWRLVGINSSSEIQGVSRQVVCSAIYSKDNCLHDQLKILLYWYR